MLDIDYPTQFGEMIGSTRCDIELPLEWSGYFEERGEVPSFANDERSNQRLKIRTHGILTFEQSVPFCQRADDPVVIYTRDFSRHGCGFLAAFQLYPEELVRIALPTFWVQLKVVRARRITSKCYEMGAALTSRHDPSPEAFTVHAC